MPKLGNEALVQKLNDIAGPVADYYGVELVEVTYHPGKHQTVRLVVYKKGGVLVDDCAAVSRRFAADLEIADVIPGRYTLEVSSPGLDRPLRNPADFRRRIGEEVSLRFSDGDGKKRTAKGTIDSVTDHTVTVGGTAYEWDKVVEGKLII